MDFFGKNMPKTVDLATHNAFATSQIGLFISISYFGLVGYTKFYGNRALYKQHRNAHRGGGGMMMSHLNQWFVSAFSLYCATGFRSNDQLGPLCARVNLEL